MWKIIRFCTLMADLTLVPSNSMKVEYLQLKDESVQISTIEKSALSAKKEIPVIHIA